MERHPVGAGGLDDLALGLVAEAALGRVHDPLERQIVVRRDGEPEIGHGIADLHPLIEAGAADDAVGQADGQEPVLEGAHLVGGADKDGGFIEGHGSETAGAPLHGLKFLPDPAGLLLPVPVADEADLFALVHLGPERLAQPAFIGGDDARGGGKDVRGGAVVLFEPDHPGAGEVLFEAEDVAHLGAAPAIDRLVVITNTADVLVPARQKAKPEVLGGVGVLVFVHKNIAEPAAILLQHIFVGLEDGEHVKEKVAEIDGVERAGDGPGTGHKAPDRRG